MSVVYLLHFDRPISDAHTAQHYIGYTPGTLERRLQLHQEGNGARLTEVAKERGIGFECVRTWEGGRYLESRLKKRRNAPKLCPVCSGNRERPTQPKYRSRAKSFSQLKREALGERKWN